MNNNQMNFDPMTGQPIQNIENNNVQPINPSMQVEPQMSTINQPIQQMNTIPTVDQTRQEFIDNTQSLTTKKIQEKKQGVNWTFMIILFVIVLGSIIFLFPYLLKNL